MTYYVMANDLPYAADGDTKPLGALGEVLALSANDWSMSRAEAWVYGIVLGWDPDPADLDEDDGEPTAMDELAARFDWSPHKVTRLRALHERFVELELAERTDQRAQTAPAPIGLVLDLHATTVSPHLLECACGWLVKRGPGAQDAWRRHLEAELLEATR